jgi:hypothetical protein
METKEKLYRVYVRPGKNAPFTRFWMGFLSFSWFEWATERMSIAGCRTQGLIFGIVFEAASRGSASRSNRTLFCLT